MQKTIENSNTLIVSDQDIKVDSFCVSSNISLINTLSNSLYSNSKVAVAREILLNAYDAHKTSNVTKPIQVTLSEDSLIIKDFGRGIDPEQIVDIYCTYGNSTKLEDNKQVGCFGLGCKSPFAYTTEFTVENCFNGKKYVYLLVKNSINSEIPTINTIIDGISTEDTGLKVTINLVDKKDEYFFKEYISTLAYFGDIPVNLNGKELKNINLKEGLNFIYVNRLLRDKNPFYILNISGGDLYVLQGSLFPIDTYKLDTETNKKINLFISKLNRLNLKIIYKPSKDEILSVTPSRENVKYDVITNNLVNNIIKHCLTINEQEIIDKIINTYLDPFLKLKDLAKIKYSLGNTLLKTINKHPRDLNSILSKTNNYCFYSLEEAFKFLFKYNKLKCINSFYYRNLFLISIINWCIKHNILKQDYININNNDKYIKKLENNLNSQLNNSKYINSNNFKVYSTIDLHTHALNYLPKTFTSIYYLFKQVIIADSVKQLTKNVTSIKSHESFVYITKSKKQLPLIIKEFKNLDFTTYNYINNNQSSKLKDRLNSKYYSYKYAYYSQDLSKDYSYNSIITRSLQKYFRIDKDNNTKLGKVVKEFYSKYDESNVYIATSKRDYINALKELKSFNDIADSYIKQLNNNISKDCLYYFAITNKDYYILYNLFENNNSNLIQNKNYPLYSKIEDKFRYIIQIIQDNPNKYFNKKIIKEVNDNKFIYCYLDNIKAFKDRVNSIKFTSIKKTRNLFKYLYFYIKSENKSKYDYTLPYYLNRVVDTSLLQVKNKDIHKYFGKLIKLIFKEF